MTREETIKLLGIITMAYPNFDKFRDEKHIRTMVNVWADLFSDDDPGIVALAVKEHISTSKWPPSIAEIRELMTHIVNPGIIPSKEAWEVVAKYLYLAGEFCRRDYHDELPQAIAETIDAIGYSQLYAMHVAYARGNAAKAGLDRITFIQAYKDKMERQLKKAMLPGSLRTAIDKAIAAHEDGSKQLIAKANSLYLKKREDRALRGYSNLLDAAHTDMPMITTMDEEQEDI